MAQQRTLSQLPTQTIPVFNRLQRLRASARWTLLERTKPGAIIKARLADGHTMWLKVGDQISHHIFVNGVHESTATSTILPFVTPDMVILDIGANVGYYSLLFAQRTGPRGRVYAFEINPAVLDVLERNVSTSGLDNLETVRLAVSDEDGTVDFFVPKPGDEGEGSLRESTRYDAEQVMQVRATTIDHFLEEHAIDRVDLIKIDIEGGESAAFAGAHRLLSSTHRPIIMFEALDSACANFGIDWLGVLDQVRGYGYVIHQVDGGNFIAVPRP